MDKGEIKIAGNGVISEGEYSKIKIMGSAKSNGHVVADEIKVMGNANFEGDIECGECTIHGNAHIVGNVSIVRLKINGDLHLDGECKVQELTVNGKVNITGAVEGKNIVTRGGLALNKELKAQALKVYGELKSPADISAEEITVEGKVNCEGLLSAERMVLHSCAQSYCREIGATSIVVEKPVYHLFWLFYDKKNILRCDTIEADEMKLENVEAKILRGKRIDLINSCEIGAVEYSERLNKGNNVTVQSEVKVD